MSEGGDGTQGVLAALLARSRAALLRGDAPAMALAAADYALDHWLDEPAPGELAPVPRCEAHRLRMEVARSLELGEEARRAHRDWLAAARVADAAAGAGSPAAGADPGPETLLARVAGAAAAVGDVDAVAEGITLSPPVEVVTALTAVAAALPGTRGRRPDPLLDHVARVLIGAALDFGELGLARSVLDWLARRPGPVARGDAFRLLQARARVVAGSLATAVADCELVLRDPAGDPGWAAAGAHRILAGLAHRRGDAAGEVRHLEAAANAAAGAGLLLAELRARRRAGAVALGHGDHAAARRVSAPPPAVLHHPPPANPVVQGITAHRARALLHLGEPAGALRAAEPVAAWAELSGCSPLAGHAYATAVDAAIACGRHLRSAVLLVRHAGQLRRDGRGADAARRIALAARSAALPDPGPGAAWPDLAEELRRGFADVERGAPPVGAPGAPAREHLAGELIAVSAALADDRASRLVREANLAYVLMLTDRPMAAIRQAEATAAAYRDTGEALPAAEALIVAAACCRRLEDDEGLRHYVGRVRALLPAGLPGDFWMLRTLEDLLGGRD
ncbi:hypothetical protein [Corynebacterium sphenisci]|uniref:hypothetical protein n=1 Tax=Corynebacterium sphenisci TaxID=191493 RepID=UPI0026DF5A9C|nr:hypothetical protein [Corynebacterium sphenisci]MDO5730712.1 hypothetical protein [Corynebacterium sphenisci]